MAKQTKLSVHAQERDWRERDDARTLAEANQITGDKTRLKKAIAKAKVIAGENEQQIQSMKMVSKKKVLGESKRAKVTKKVKAKSKK